MEPTDDDDRDRRDYELVGDCPDTQLYSILDNDRVGHRVSVPLGWQRYDDLAREGRLQELHDAARGLVWLGLTIDLDRRMASISLQRRPSGWKVYAHELEERNGHEVARARSDLAYCPDIESAEHIIRALAWGADHSVFGDRNRSDGQRKIAADTAPVSLDPDRGDSRHYYRERGESEDRHHKEPGYSPGDSTNSTDPTDE